MDLLGRDIELEERRINYTVLSLTGIYQFVKGVRSTVNALAKRNFEFTSNTMIHTCRITTYPSAAIIRENLQWHTPVEIAPNVKAQYHSVTSSQVHFAWTQMSEILWKRDKMQLPSAETLLKELGDEVDVLAVPPADGVEQLCWAMKKIIQPLKGQIVEIAIDATCVYTSVSTFSFNSYLIHSF